MQYIRKVKVPHTGLPIHTHTHTANQAEKFQFEKFMERDQFGTKRGRNMLILKWTSHFRSGSKLYTRFCRLGVWCKESTRHTREVNTEPELAEKAVL